MWENDEAMAGIAEGLKTLSANRSADTNPTV
jgi:hypothetical protein